MKKKKPTYYHNETYGKTYQFFLGWDNLEVQAWIRKEMKWPDFLLEGSNFLGRTIEITGPESRVLIITRPEVSAKQFYSVLAHECAHAAGISLRQVGAKPDFHNDEPFCYLLERIMEAALKKRS